MFKNDDFQYPDTVWSIYPIHQKAPMAPDDGFWDTEQGQRLLHSEIHNFLSSKTSARFTVEIIQAMHTLFWHNPVACTTVSVPSVPTADHIQTILANGNGGSWLTLEAPGVEVWRVLPF
jgi:hypothetical protein